MIDVDLDNLPSSNIRTNFQSFAASTVSFNLPYGSGEAPYEKLSECRVKRHGKVVLAGPVTECEESRDAAGDRVWSVEISDRWHWLETCSYVTELTRYNKPSSRAYVPMCVPGGRYVMVDPGVYKPKEDKSDTALTPTIAIGAAFTDIIDNSKHLNCKLKLDFDHEQEMIPFEASLSYLADLMRAVQQWRPGLTSKFDYTDPDNPQLIITDKGDVITLDAKRDNLTTIALKPRPDLIPPVVGVLGLATTGSQNISYTMAVYPPDSESKFKDPGALLLSVSLPSGTQTSESAPSRGALPNELINMTPEEAQKLLGIPVVKTPAETATDVLPSVSNMLKYNSARATLRGKKFPDKAEDWAAWWMQKAPQLFGGKQIKTTRPPKKEPTTPDAIYSNHVSENLDYEWVSGQYNGVGKGVKWTALKIEQEIYINDPPDELKSRFPTYVGANNTYMGKVACYVHALGHANKSYALDPDGTELPDEGIEEAPIEPEEDPGSGDPVPEPSIDEAMPQYDQVAEAVWKASQKLEFEGTISVIGKAMPVRPGDRINIVNDRPEYVGMETTVQSVTVDEYAGTMTLAVGPASHLSLQTAAERARIMSDNANKALSKTDELTTSLNHKVASEGETEAPGPDPEPGGSSTTITYPPRQRPQAAEVGPCFRMIEASAGKVDIVAEFSVRGVWSDDGSELQSVQWYGGKVYGPKDVFQVGKQNEWNDLYVTSGDIYCNVKIDKEGKIKEAKIETTEGATSEGKIFAVGKKGKSGDEYTPSGSGWEGEDATMSFQIATVEKDAIVHNHLGSISVPIKPMYVLFECKDFLEGTPVSEEVSLIEEQKDRYTLLKRLMPGKEIKFGGISEADPPRGFLKINAREVKVKSVPKLDGSDVEPGLDLFDSKEMDNVDKDKANWERTFFFNTIRAMEKADYDRYDGGNPNGTRCRVVIDLRDGVLLVGAYSGTMTDPP